MPSCQPDMDMGEIGAMDHFTVMTMWSVFSSPIPCDLKEVKAPCRVWCLFSWHDTPVPGATPIKQSTCLETKVDLNLQVLPVMWKSSPQSLYFIWSRTLEAGRSEYWYHFTDELTLAVRSCPPAQWALVFQLEPRFDPSSQSLAHSFFVVVHFKKQICWSIADLQCCVSFCCTEEWFRYICVCIYIYIYIYISFSYSFPWWFITG